MQLHPGEKGEMQLHPGREMGNVDTSGGVRRNVVASGVRNGECIYIRGEKGGNIVTSGERKGRSRYIREEVMT